MRTEKNKATFHLIEGNMIVCIDGYYFRRELLAKDVGGNCGLCDVTHRTFVRGKVSDVPGCPRPCEAMMDGWTRTEDQRHPCHVLGKKGKGRRRYKWIKMDPLYADLLKVKEMNNDGNTRSKPQL